MALKVRKSKALPPPPGCPMAACMAVLGGAWTPSLIWKLSGDARRFGELQRDIPGISPKMLTARLRDLEEKGVVVRSVCRRPRLRSSTRCPSSGRELIPVINTIVRVGTRIREGAFRPASAASR